MYVVTWHKTSRLVMQDGKVLFSSCEELHEQILLGISVIKYTWQPPKSVDSKPTARKICAMGKRRLCSCTQLRI